MHEVLKDLINYYKIAISKVLLHVLERETCRDKNKEKQIRKVKFSGFFLGSPQLDSDSWGTAGWLSEFGGLLFFYVASAGFL